MLIIFSDFPGVAGCVDGPSLSCPQNKKHVYEPPQYTSYYQGICDATKNLSMFSLDYQVKCMCSKCHLFRNLFYVPGCSTICVSNNGIRWRYSITKMQTKWSNTRRAMKKLNK